MPKNYVHADIDASTIARDPINLLFNNIDRVFAELQDGGSFSFPIIVQNFGYWLLDIFLLDELFTPVISPHFHPLNKFGP